jgi:hypothetical protein
VATAAPLSAQEDAALPASGLRCVLALGDATLEAVARVGGKNASLGEMLRTLGSQGIRIPRYW